MKWRGLRYVPPRSFSKGRPAGKPRIIFVHYTAGAEGPTSAEDGARYDQRRTDGTSAHYYVDRDSVVQCVDTADRSHTALYNANLVGIHYELCGTRQTRAQWLDPASRATLRTAARQMALDMLDNDIPLRRLTARQVRPKTARGLAGHVDATRGWPEDGGTHTDPGADFPWDVLFSDITAELDKIKGGAMPKPKYSAFLPWYTKWGANVQSLLFWFTTVRPRERAEVAALRADVDALRVELDKMKAGG